MYKAKPMNLEALFSGENPFEEVGDVKTVDTTTGEVRRSAIPF